MKKSVLIRLFFLVIYTIMDHETHCQEIMSQKE